MIRSMTGFGSAEGPLAGGRFQVDLKSVNHRHFNLQLKAPSELSAFEQPIRDRLRGRIDRGHVTLAARWVEEPARQNAMELNIDRAREVYEALRSLKRKLGMEGNVSLDLVARQADVFVQSTPDESSYEWEEIEAVVDAALTKLVAARDREGAALMKELSLRFGGIAKRLAHVESLAPKRMVKERDRLQTAVAAIMNGQTLPEERLAQEIALLADKLDISEETVRLRAHLRAARDTIETGGPVGKQLTFLAQEMLREINTIGSKANDSDIAHDVVAMKGEIEKIREQVENVE
jgi:uncharacterized protein (TIGR00255 family)